VYAARALEINYGYRGSMAKLENRSGKIVVKWILEEFEGKALTEFVWLRIGSSGLY
jgi:DNA-directed RNA polymerase subunit K/omega